MENLPRKSQLEVRLMSKFVLSILFLFLLVPLARAQDCDCTITPFKPNPPCFNKCAVGLLAGANLKDLQFAFGLKKDTAEKLLEWQKGHHAETLEDYHAANILTAKQIEALKKKIDSFTDVQLEYLAKPAAQRRTFAPGAIRDLFKYPT